MGGWVSSFTEEAGEGAVAFAVTDDGAAQEGVDKLAATGGTEPEDRDYNGTSYKFADDVAYGIVGDFMVIGTEQGFQEAVDASNGDSLADDSAATDALDSVPDGTLAAAYVDVQSADRRRRPGPRDHPAGARAVRRHRPARQLRRRARRLRDGRRRGQLLRSRPPGRPARATSRATDIMTTLPSEAWFAFGAPDVGGRIAETYQQFVDAFETGLESGIGDVQDSLDAQGLKPTDIPEIDVEIEKQLGLDITKDLGWIGNVGGFVQGTSIFDLGGGIVIETDDPDAAAAALAKLRTALGRDRSLKITETEDGGFNIQTRRRAGRRRGRDPRRQGRLRLRRRDDRRRPRAVGDAQRLRHASAAPTALWATTSTRPSTSTWRRSCRSSRARAAASDPDYAMAAPYLSAIDYMIAGGGVSDDRADRPVRDRRPGADGHLVGHRRGGDHAVAMPERAPRPGVDLIEIERIERALDRRPRLAGRLFTDAEVAYAEARARPGPPPGRALRRQGGGDQGARQAAGAARDRGRQRGGRSSGAPPARRRRRARRSASRWTLTVSLTHSRETAAAVVIAS